MRAGDIISGGWAAAAASIAGLSVLGVSWSAETLPGVSAEGDERHRWCVCVMSWSARVATESMLKAVARRARRRKG